MDLNFANLLAPPKPSDSSRPGSASPKAGISESKEAAPKRSFADTLAASDSAPSTSKGAEKRQDGSDQSREVTSVQTNTNRADKHKVEKQAEDMAAQAALANIPIVIEKPEISSKISGIDASPLDQEALGELRKVLGTGETLVEKSPVLALLTGRLEHLDPRGIPDLVASNKLLSAAFAEPDAGIYLNKPAPLGELLTGLGIDAGSQQKLIEQGIDLTAEIEPRQLLSELGVDAQRVSIELDLLRTNVRSADGLSSYIVRAERLSGAKSSRIDERDSAASAPASVNANRLGSSDGPHAGEPHARLLDPPAIEQATPDAAEGRKAEAHSRSDTEGSRTAFAPDERAVSPEGSHSQSAVIEPESSQLAPMRAVRVEHDPFATLETKVDAKELRTEISSPSHELGLEASTDEQAILRAFSRIGDRVPKPQLTTKGGAELASVLRLPNQVASTDQARAFDVPSDTFELTQLVANGAWLNNASSPVRQSQPTASLSGLDSQRFHDLTLERLAASAKGIEVLEPTGMGRDFGGNHEEHGQMNGQSQMLEWMVPQSPSDRLTSTSVENAFADELAFSAPERMVGKIVERAEMLVKEGGGSVRLNLGSELLGKLELALRVDQERVELKILAASDHIRELLNQNMPKLRESLAAQELMLTDVEVASQETYNGQSQFSGEERQSRTRQQDYLEDVHALSSMRALSQANTQPSRAVIDLAARQFLAQHSGRIQIRA